MKNINFFSPSFFLIFLKIFQFATLPFIPKTVEQVNLDQSTSIACLKLRSNTTYFKKSYSATPEQKLLNNLFFRQILPKISSSFCYFATSFVKFTSFLNLINYKISLFFNFHLKTHVLLEFANAGSGLSKFEPWPCVGLKN